jgi:hypothetical protein
VAGILSFISPQFRGEARTPCLSALPPPSSVISNASTYPTPFHQVDRFHRQTNADFSRGLREHISEQLAFQAAQQVRVASFLHPFIFEQLTFQAELRRFDFLMGAPICFLMGHLFSCRLVPLSAGRTTYPCSMASRLANAPHVPATNAKPHLCDPRFSSFSLQYNSLVPSPLQASLTYPRRHPSIPASQTLLPEVIFSASLLNATIPPSHPPTPESRQAQWSSLLSIVQSIETVPGTDPS